MSLTDRAIINRKPAGKDYKCFDGGGLYIQVSSAGGKLWRQDYRFKGKPKRLSHGAYPAVTLKMARDLRDAAKALLAQGIDPSEEKKARKRLDASNAQNTFEAVAREWHETEQKKWNPKRAKTILSRLEADIFPSLGKKPIAVITPPELLSAIKAVEKRDAIYAAHRLMQFCGRIFLYAIATGKATHNIAADLRGALSPHKAKHFASITEPRKVGELLRALDGYEGDFTVSCALKVSPLVFTRPSELRRAAWSEFDFEQATWRIPAKWMKMGEQHIVPLSRQALDIFRKLHEATGSGRLLFPSLRSAKRPISDNTLNAALRRMGYAGDVMTCHGFRSMASTLLNEKGWNRDAIERQLAHGERNSVRAAYNFAEFLPERRRMMQDWADYLDELKQRRD